MKQLILTIVALLTLTTSSSAMGYQQARLEALFLTDKMAYELNLTEEQYEAAYEINLDYLMSLDTADDLYGVYWTHRNLDLSYILLDWQYRAFAKASYFYRPVWFNAGYWSFGIYARYPRRDYFYFGQPRFYTVYRGGHSWRMNGNRSWYYERNFAGTRRGREFGMRDHFDRGYYGNGMEMARAPRRDFQSDRTRSFGTSPSRSYGGGYAPSRESSTRTTVGRNPGAMRNNPLDGNRNFGNTAPSRSFSSPGRSFSPSPSQSQRPSPSAPSRSFSPSQGSSSFSSPSRSFGNSAGAGSSRSFTGGTFSGHR